METIGFYSDDLVLSTAEHCAACQDSCHRTESALLQRPGTEHAFILHLQAAACACQMTAESLRRRSPYSDRLAEMAAEICERCLVECESRRGETVVSECMEDCRRCARECRRVSVLLPKTGSGVVFGDLAESWGPIFGTDHAF